MPLFDPEDLLTRRRLHWLLKIAGAVVLLLMGVLLRYQVISRIQEDSLARPASNQRQRGVAVTLARGSILDRHGVPLHCPTWSQSLLLLPPGVRHSCEDLADPEGSFVLAALGLEDILGSVSSAPVKVVVPALQPNEYARFLEGGISGVDVVPDEVRYGPGSIARHVVGYVRSGARTNSGDNVGEDGLEKWYQRLLAKGPSSWAGITATGEGTELPGAVLRIAPPEGRSADLTTTLDAAVQLAVEQVLDERDIKKGAVVVLDALNAEIVAMASRPSFDQNAPEMYLGLETQPLLNRAISEFGPGSAWLPVVAGFFLENNHVPVCMSLDEVVAEAASFLDLTGFLEYATGCGFGAKTGVPLPNERDGALPEYHGDGGEPVCVSGIMNGYGSVLVTPLQLTAFYRAIIGGGRWLCPILIPGTYQETRAAFSPVTAERLEKELLAETLHHTKGVAWVPVYGSAGKAGTALAGLPEPQTSEPQAFELVTDSWFCGWTPLLAPRYVLGVFVQETEDHDCAARLFRQISLRILKR